MSAWSAAGLLLFWLLTIFVAERYRLMMLFAYAPQVFFVLPTLLLVVASLLRRKRRAQRVWMAVVHTSDHRSPPQEARVRQENSDFQEHR